MEPETPTAERTARLADQFRRALDSVEGARPVGKSLYQNHVFELAIRLLKEPDGVPSLYGEARRFDQAGLFHGGDWNRPQTLQSPFAETSLRGPALYVGVEALSELRFLAIAEGQTAHPEIDPARARRFLEEILARNLDLLFPTATEEDRVAGSLGEGVHRLLRFLAERIGIRGILEAIVDEAEMILAQRPIQTRRIRGMLDTAATQIDLNGESAVYSRARRLIDALLGPTDLARTAPEPAAYVEALRRLSSEELEAESAALARSMHATGLVSRQHAALLRHLVASPRESLATALGLDPVGRNALATFDPLVRTLIDFAIHPATAQSILGLASLLNRGLLFFPPVAPSLWRLTALPIDPSVGETLTEGWELSAQPILLSGVLSVLGQPLGVSQGRNPTCQSARAISLWAQIDPGYLLELIAWAARDGEIEMHFEGQSIVSSSLQEGLVKELHRDLDPVSLVLVPHLDRIYMEMGRRTLSRDQDSHKWINPEFHGFWVHRGFVTAIQPGTGAVVDFEGFCRRFHTAYHPYYNGGRVMIYPQPAGIVVTNVHAEFVGWHAVSIQRVALDPNGTMRVYFFDPNDNVVRDWGQGIEASTSGRGEVAGESSLPFFQFAARLYVFHYNPREEGDPGRVPPDEVREIASIARQGWARGFGWTAPEPPIDAD